MKRSDVWTSPRAKALEPVCRSWLKECERFHEITDDACWWYNERANTSVFAIGAAKVKGWVALEEFAARKRHVGEDGAMKSVAGRCDLFITTAESGYAIEFKQAWQSLFPNGGSYKQINAKWNAAWNDIGSVHSYEADERLAGLFVVPSCPIKKNRDAKSAFANLVESVKKLPGVDVMSWYSRSEPIKDSGKKYSYPGVILALRLRTRATRAKHQ